MKKASTTAVEAVLNSRWGRKKNSTAFKDNFRRDLPVFPLKMVEASVKMPLCADFGNGENASKDAANLDEA